MNSAQRRKLESLQDRRERTVGLWLTRVVAFLTVFESSIIACVLHGRIERFLNVLTDCVVDFIAMRATLTPGYQKRVAQGRAAGCKAAWSGAALLRASPRALIGGFLRRALKAKTLKGRAEKLLAVLRNRDAWVAHMAKRLERGQSRIYSAHSRVAKTLPSCRAEAMRAVAVFSGAAIEQDLRGVDMS